MCRGAAARLASAHRRAVRRTLARLRRARAASIKGRGPAPIQRLVAAASFADVLDDVLGRASQAAPARAAWAASPGIADSGAFVFARPLTSGTAWTRAYPRPVAPSPRRAVIEVQQ